MSEQDEYDWLNRMQPSQRYEEYRKLKAKLEIVESDRNMARGVNEQMIAERHGARRGEDEAIIERDDALRKVEKLDFLVGHFETQLRRCAVETMRSMNLETCSPADFTYVRYCQLCHMESDRVDDEDDLKDVIHKPSCLLASKRGEGDS